jgi:hypothetical protein
VKNVGINHVGIRGDFDGIAEAANVVADVSKMPALVAVLLNRGYTEGDMKKLLGENHLRVVREVTRAQTVRRCPMKAARIQRFSPPSAITIDDLTHAEPAAEELLVRVKAAGWVIGTHSFVRAESANRCL